MADQALPWTRPEPIRPETWGGVTWPGRSQEMTHAPWLGQLNGTAKAISPCREYAATSVIVALIGRASATARVPYTVTGCKTSTVPLPSLTVTYETSACTAPIWTWAAVPKVHPIRGAGPGPACVPRVGIGRFSPPSAPTPSPATIMSWSPGWATSAPGRSAMIHQRWPLMVPDAIRPGWAPGPGAWTVTV